MLVERLPHCCQTPIKAYPRADSSMDGKDDAGLSDGDPEMEPGEMTWMEMLKSLQIKTSKARSQPISSSLLFHPGTETQL